MKELSCCVILKMSDSVREKLWYRKMSIKICYFIWLRMVMFSSERLNSKLLIFYSNDTYHIFNTKQFLVIQQLYIYLKRWNISINKKSDILKENSSVVIFSRKSKIEKLKWWKMNWFFFFISMNITEWKTNFPISIEVILIRKSFLIY